MDILWSVSLGSPFNFFCIIIVTADDRSQLVLVTPTSGPFVGIVVADDDSFAAGILFFGD